MFVALQMTMKENSVSVAVPNWKAQLKMQLILQCQALHNRPLEEITKFNNNHSIQLLHQFPNPHTLHKGNILRDNIHPHHKSQHQEQLHKVNTLHRHSILKGNIHQPNIQGNIHQPNTLPKVNILHQLQPQDQ